MSRICKNSFLIFALFFVTLFVGGWANAKGVEKLKTFKDCAVCSEMVVIPAGKYMMGATEAELEGQQNANIKRTYETPVHEVQVKSFSIGRFHVTRLQFSVFAKETGFDGEGCTIYKDGQWRFDPDANWQRPGFDQSDKDPVVCISWDDAQKYVAWLNGKVGSVSKHHYRLPKEDEWEFAARSGTAAPMYWGASRKKQCEYENARDKSAQVLDPDIETVPCDDHYVWTSPVGSFRPNQWGLYDMLGNAFQWVEDCMHIGYKSLSTTIASAPDECRNRVQRGGSWASIPIGVRAANRTAAPPDSRSSTDGFRIATDF